jgi:heme-degrading monooxygenase HmoA
MIVVANRIYVNPDYADQFEERFAQRAHLVDNQPGFEANLVLRPTGENEPYVVLSYWESRDAFEAWTKSDAFVKGHAKSGTLPKEVFTAPSVLEVHEVILDSRDE